MMLKVVRQNKTSVISAKFQEYHRILTRLLVAFWQWIKRGTIGIIKIKTNLIMEVELQIFHMTIRSSNKIMTLVLKLDLGFYISNPQIFQKVIKVECINQLTNNITMWLMLIRGKIKITLSMKPIQIWWEMKIPLLEVSILTSKLLENMLWLLEMAVIRADGVILVAEWDLLIVKVSFHKMEASLKCLDNQGCQCQWKIENYYQLE